MQTTERIMSAPGEPAGEGAIDFNRIIKALVELNVARKNVLFYPGAHRHAKKSIDRAYDYLNLALETAQTIVLVVARESLSVEGSLLDPANSALQELKAVFKSKNIAVLTFRQGLSRGDVVAFLSRITRNQESLGPAPAENVMVSRENSTGGIRIQAPDYSKLSHAVKEVIHKNSQKGRKTPKASIWNDFVHGLAAGILLGSDAAEPGRTGRRPFASAIAGYLNQFDTIEPGLLRKYESLVNDHLQNALCGNENHGESGWIELYRCLEQLEPGLRDPFLTALFDQCAIVANPESLIPFFSRMPSKLMIEMLQAAAGAGKEVSPSLLNFIGKMVNARSTSSQPADRASSRRSADEIAALATSEQAGSLFEKENLSAYVTPDYEAALKRLLRNQSPREAPAEDPFDAQQHLKIFEEDHLTERIAEATIALMSGPIDVGLYRELAEQLVGLAHELVPKAHIILLSKIHELFLRHSRTEPADARGTAARAAFGMLFDAKTIRALRTSLEASGRWADPAAVSFLFNLGPEVVPDALHLYLYRSEPEREQWLAALYGRYPQHLLKEVIKRLQFNPDANTEALLTIFEKLGDSTHTDCIRPFLKHPEKAVQVQALGALLNLNDAQGVNYLKSYLNSKQNQDFSIGLQMAEKYSVVCVAPDLCKRLKTRFLFHRSDIVRNEKILAVLQKLGHRVAPGELERLRSIRFSFYPKHLARMKLLASDLLLNQSLKLQRGRIERPPRQHEGGIIHGTAQR